MRTIFAEYNPQCNSIDVYTSAGYMLRIDCRFKFLQQKLDQRRFSRTTVPDDEYKFSFLNVKTHVIKRRYSRGVRLADMF